MTAGRCRPVFHFQVGGNRASSPGRCPPWIGRASLCRSPAPGLHPPRTVCPDRSLEVVSTQLEDECDPAARQAGLQALAAHSASRFTQCSPPRCIPVTRIPCKAPGWPVEIPFLPRHSGGVRPSAQFLPPAAAAGSRPGTGAARPA